MCTSARALNIWRENQILTIAESEKDSCTRRQLTRTKARERKAFSKGKRTSVNQSNAERCPLQIPKRSERTVPAVPAACNGQEHFHHLRKHAAVVGLRKRGPQYTHSAIFESIHLLLFFSYQCSWICVIISFLRCFLVWYSKRLECWEYLHSEKAIIEYCLIWKFVCECCMSTLCPWVTFESLLFVDSESELWELLLLYSVCKEDPLISGNSHLLVGTGRRLQDWRSNQYKLLGAIFLTLSLSYFDLILISYILHFSVRTVIHILILSGFWNKHSVIIYLISTQ